MKQSRPTLRAQQITKTYGTNTVLAGVDIELAPGEWLGILGESGSGKSTLLRILGRFLDAEQGDVYFKGQLLKPVASELMPGHEGIRLIHQEFELFPNQTVEENIAYSLRFYEPDYRASKVAELLETTGLKNVKDRKAKLLSGGEKQRTAIAKSIAELPDVLLLDEPFAHLDNHNRRVLADAIELLRKREKMGCIFVTHEAADALAWSDRIAVLREGQIIQIGTPQEVYHNPANSYVAELTGDINWIAGENGSKQFYIRPEKIKPTRNHDKCRWAGKVEAVRFHGNHWEIRCVRGRERLSFYRNKPDLEVGQEVQLTYTSKDLKSI